MSDVGDGVPQRVEGDRRQQLSAPVIRENLLGGWAVALS
jgi:hypothetical protein